jgi:hypothetical protein
VDYQLSVLCGDSNAWKEEPRLMSFEPIENDERGSARYKIFWDSSSLAPINSFFNTENPFAGPPKTWLRYGPQYAALSRAGKMIDSLPLFETFQQRMMRQLRSMCDKNVFQRVFSLLKNDCPVCGYDINTRCLCAQRYGLPSSLNVDDDGDDVLTPSKRRRTQD